MPDRWISLFPLLYYFIGCYIGEYKIKIDKRKLLLTLFTVVSITTVLLYIYNYNETFSWFFLGGYGGITTVICSTIIFLLLYDIDLKKPKLNKIITNISILSLDIYLFSYISDNLVYTSINTAKDIKDYYLLLPILISISFAISYIASLIKSIIFKLLLKTKTN